MPLFESQRARNKRVFFRVNSELIAEIDARTRQYPEEGTAYAACVMGGTIAANRAVEDLPTLKKAWGRGDESRAIALVEVFTLAMASRWYWRLDQFQQHPESERRRGREVFVSNLLALFGDDLSTAVSDFMKLDAQFNYDRERKADEKRSGVPLEEEALLLSCSMQTLGYPPGLDVSRLTLPAEDLRELLVQGGRLESKDFTDSLGMTVLLSVAERFMYDMASRFSTEGGH